MKKVKKSIKKKIKKPRVTNGKKHKTPIIRGVKNPPNSRKI